MNRIRIPILALLILGFSIKPIYAQETLSWVGEVERGLVKEGWGVVGRKIGIDGSTGKVAEVIIELRNQDSNVTIILREIPSLKHARDDIKYSIKAFEATKSRIRVNKFSKIGEENFLVFPSPGMLKLTFRKGRVVAIVTTSSQETLERVAQLLAGLVPVLK